VQLALALTTPSSPNRATDSSALAIVVWNSWCSGLVSTPEHPPMHSSNSFLQSTGLVEHAETSYARS
jgi:hypothetical protein